MPLRGDQCGGCTYGLGICYCEYDPDEDEAGASTVEATDVPNLCTNTEY